MKVETVRVMPLPRDKSQIWFKAEIEELADVRSYKVKTEDEIILCRNRRHLCSSREPLYNSQPREALVALQPPGYGSLSRETPRTSANTGSVIPNSASSGGQV